MRRAKAAESWTVVVVAEGSPRDAENAARRARRLVAEWILRDNQCQSGIAGLSRSKGPRKEVTNED